MAAGSALVISPIQSCQQMKLSENIQSYLDHFEVSPAMLQETIRTALSKGGDYADLFFEHTIAHNISLSDNKVNQANSSIDYGVGIRVLKGDQTGYAYSEAINKEYLLSAAKTAANIASSSNTQINPGIQELTPASYYKINSSWETTSIQEKIPYVQQLNDRIFELDNKVVKVKVFMNDQSSYVLFYNSEGTLTYDYRPMVSFGALCIMEKGEQIENAYAARAFRKGFEFITAELVESLAQEVIEKTNILFGATKPKSGTMPVVMGAGGSGILLHEAVGHAFEADFNRKGTSIFADKLGQKVAHSAINIVDDGTVAYNRGAINVDDEGNPSCKTYLVKDGVLNSYIHDRISAKHYGVSPTGNGRRESFRHVPMPRMTATYMEAGNTTEEDIISQVKQGVYVDNFANGEVKIGAGDFTFYVKSGYLIENGKLTQAIKDINIVGNGPQALADITLVADNCKIDNGTWTCGKDGQSAPVTCGLPSVLIKSLTVGGS